MTTLTGPQVLGYAIAAGFTRDQANTLTVIAHYESGWNTENVGDQTLSKYGSRGLTQIFTGVHSPSELKIGTGVWTPELVAKLNDPLINMKAALTIFKEQGYRAWSTYNSLHSTAAWAALLAHVASMVPITPGPASPPVTPPKISLSKLIRAATIDPPAPQGVASDPTTVRPVQAALIIEALLDPYWAKSGAYGTMTVAAYAKWQKSLKYSGRDADGIPGLKSLTTLANKHGFIVIP